MTFDARRAKKFVESIDLSRTPRRILQQQALTSTGEIFDQAKSQAQIVGSGVFSFAEGVTAEVREAISNSALLAQLVANNRVSAEQSPLEWFTAYSDVLQNVGWTLQERGWTDYTAKGNSVEVNEKILEVMTVALGPSPAALVIITATINALKAMKSDTPWMQLFSQESEKARIARFRIGLVEKGAGSDVFVSLLACLIEADKNITQVLFFKFRDAKATFRANSAKVSIDRAALADLGTLIRARVRDYQTDYLSTVLDL